MINWTKKEAYCEEFNTPIAAMPRVLEKNIKSGLAHYAVIVPEVRKLWLEDVKTIASAKGVVAITWADEISESMEAVLIAEYQKHPDNPELQALDAKIKQQYGHGKYGIPKDENEGNPLAWIAYRRALNDELVSLFRESYNLAKSINPDILVISDDPVGHQNRLYAFADWKGIVDIPTFQLYPRHSPNVDSFGFMTRYVKTLTGATEVWPCTHIEEYATTFEPKEVLFKLSAAVRNGATGFHYYLNDTIGLRSNKKYMIHEYFGAPDRYAVEIGAMKLVSQMPRIKFPDYDCAVFTATDSLRAMTGLMNRRNSNRDMYLHGFLGYGAGVNYRFVNEICLENLEKYTFIATVENNYVSREAFEALRQYVVNGGNLLIMNTQDAFTFTPDGEDLRKESLPFMGVKAIGDSQNPTSFSYAGVDVPVTAIRCAKLQLLPSAQVLAKFVNGDPAVVANSVGKGKVVTLAGNPCVSKLAGNAEWKQFFLNLCKGFGTKTQCDFWRFQLPDSLLPKETTTPGKCLTNNYVKWLHFEPTTPNQSSVTGSYVLLPEPKRSRDVASGEISFAKGKLTDRPRAVVGPSSCRGKGTWADWAVAWNKEEQPITIQSKWSATQNVTSVKLFVSGIWRNATLQIGGKSYSYPCIKEFNEDTLSVRVVEMKLPQPVAASELTITLEPNPENVIIAEMEIWAE